MKRRQSHEFPEPCGYLGSVGGGDEDMAVEEEEHRVPMSVVSNNTRGLESPICGPPEVRSARSTLAPSQECRYFHDMLTIASPVV